ncbi:MAG: hypothetical protein HDR17_14750 [Lachnospiraceae bacterium]|nr:hypothetical protein [Lachnospiraceae bacterium]
MELFLTLVSGICWCIVYEECIRLSIKDKTYAMPFWALAMNITWEGIYAVFELRIGIGVQPIVNLIWFLLDIMILFFYFKYAQKELKPGEKAWSFYAWSILGIAAMFAVQLSFFVEFGPEDHLSAQYSAFIQNLIMSVAFINMLHKRNSSDGQSVLLAVAKWIGTLAPTITMGVLSTNYVVLVCGLLCSVYDVIYIVLLYRIRKSTH